jgi:hypothetical protein
MTHQHIIQQLLHIAAVEAHTSAQVDRRGHVVALIDVCQREVAAESAAAHVQHTNLGTISAQNSQHNGKPCSTTNPVWPLRQRPCLCGACLVHVQVPSLLCDSSSCKNDCPRQPAPPDVPVPRFPVVQQQACPSSISNEVGMRQHSTCAAQQAQHVTAQHKAHSEV